MQSNVIKVNKKLLYVTQSRYDAGWHSIPHTHNFTEFFYVIRGKGQFFVNEVFHDIKEDDLIIVNPHVLHTETSKDDAPLEYIVVGVEGLAFFTEQDDERQFDFSIHNYYNYKHEILFYLKTLSNEVESKDEFSVVLQHNLLEALIINMIRRTNITLEVATTSKKDKRECIFIEKYIKEHFKEDITLDKLSELTYINKYYMVHAFKKYKGISPINYLVECRIAEAKMLLETTNLSSRDIANIVGFSSQSYFSQVFKRLLHTSPQQYRKTFIS
ncbi:AraC family transcriptional regulator [Amedibacillus sp. YH-ame6]